MPRTAAVNPSNNGRTNPHFSGTAAERRKLRDVLAALKLEQERLETLQAARERAREESWMRAPQVTEAEAAFSRAKAEETARLARAFAAGELGALTPVEAAQTALDVAKVAYREIERIEAALDSELGVSANRASRLKQLFTPPWLT